ncbi:hypothetical protein P4E94_19790 [Pontiellaceae bacterium B12219]|nr:hypothetical protein [Pontiellaceae bacterium B12219]
MDVCAETSKLRTVLRRFHPLVGSFLFQCMLAQTMNTPKTIAGTDAVNTPVVFFFFINEMMLPMKLPKIKISDDVMMIELTEYMQIAKVKHDPMIHMINDAMIRNTRVKEIFRLGLFI